MDERRRRPRLALLLVPIGCLVVASNVGSALAPTLVTEHPLWLLSLDARSRHLVLVSARVDAVPYYLIGALRLLASDPLFYLLGYWYGESALAWLDARTGRFGQFLRSAESFFSKASYPLVFLAPNNYICLFAGASRMPPPVFLVLNISGTIGRLVLLRLVGDVFEDPIDAVLGFIRRNQWRLTLLTIGIVVVQVVWDRRRGPGELESLSELSERAREQTDVEAVNEGDEGGTTPAPSQDRSERDPT